MQTIQLLSKKKVKWSDSLRKVIILSHLYLDNIYRVLHFFLRTLLPKN